MGLLTMLQNTWMHALCGTSVSDSGAGDSSSISEPRAQPYISVLSSSNSMHFVTHAVVQSCAAGARMTSEVDTSQKRGFACLKCGKLSTHKGTHNRHSKICKGPKTCDYCSYNGNNIIGYVFEACAAFSIALPKT